MNVTAPLRAYDGLDAGNGVSLMLVGTLLGAAPLGRWFTGSIIDPSGNDVRGVIGGGNYRVVIAGLGVGVALFGLISLAARLRPSTLGPVSLAVVSLVVEIVGLNKQHNTLATLLRNDYVASNGPSAPHANVSYSGPLIWTILSSCAVIFVTVLVAVSRGNYDSTREYFGVAISDAHRET